MHDYHPPVRRGNAFDGVCMCMCMCVCLSFCTVRALTFDSLDLQTSFLVCRYIFGISSSQLQWLPVIQHVNYKLALFAYKVQTTSAPGCLCSTVTAATSYNNNRLMRSSLAPHFAILLTRTEIGKCAFWMAVPTVWNCLPIGVRLSGCLAISKRRLKTTLYRANFSTQISHYN